MRFAWYAGISTALAASVVVSAFHQRANFYSAMVYLAQSNLCLLVLINFIYLIYGTAVFGLQKLLFGTLRQVEVEQLSEKAWFAITETCLAMTIFRDEIGPWFLVMFTLLITGKVWGWISDGRVEILEQQPPTNPSLFHTRLSISLLISIVYDIALLRYSINSVILQARPDMMVMFLFEFAVLTTCSLRTGARYGISVAEHRIIRDQTKLRLQERRRQVRLEREEILRQREQSPPEEGEDQPAPPHEDDIDEMDIEVPGWETKGQWILVLDLVADCTKFSIYVLFFFILFSFYGLPIHIMRDLFMTGRAVYKRGKALYKYRKAVEDMNRYADATSEDISREDTCIICREEMRPWDANDAASTLQRNRPKKLPCGHILHMGCLKSWLERQQVCPTCRRSVVLDDAGVTHREAAFRARGMGAVANPAAGVAPPPAAGQAPAPAPGAPAMQAQPGQQPGPNNHADGAAPPGAPQAGQPPAAQAQGEARPRRNRDGLRVWNLGPVRIGFAQGNDVHEVYRRMNQPHRGAGPAAPAAPSVPSAPHAAQPSPGSVSQVADVGVREQLQDLDRRVQRQIQSLQLDQQQLQVINHLTTELERIRTQQQILEYQNLLDPSQSSGVPNTGNTHGTPFPSQQSMTHLQTVTTGVPPVGGGRLNAPALARYGGGAQASSIPAGGADLPEGVSLPAGWSLMPLQRLDGGPIQQAQADSPVGSSSAAPVAPQAATGDAANPTITTSSSSSSSNAPAASNANINAGRRPEAPEILAPNPVMPNWGGENQLFGANSGLSSAGNAGSDAAASLGESPAQDPTGTGEASLSQTSSCETNEEGAKGKGKAKAVTVEDADDRESNGEAQ